jgi:hypothetical protein
MPDGEQEMNFTDAGLARIKTPEFLLTLQQLPQNEEAIIFLAISACSNTDGTLIVSSEEEAFHFIRAHREQLANLMMEAQDAVIAMQNGMYSQNSRNDGGRQQ